MPSVDSEDSPADARLPASGKAAALSRGGTQSEAGTAPADDVHLLLWSDAKGIWREECPDIERPPEMPRARSMFDIDILRPQLPHFDVGNLRHRDDPIEGPNIPEDDAAETEYTVQRVKHHVPCLLPKVYFQFDADENIASFAINNRLVAANISEPREGTLHVKITLGPPAPAPDPEVFTSREGDDD